MILTQARLKHDEEKWNNDDKKFPLRFCFLLFRYSVWMSLFSIVLKIVLRKFLYQPSAGCLRCVWEHSIVSIVICYPWALKMLLPTPFIWTAKYTNHDKCHSHIRPFVNDHFVELVRYFFFVRSFCWTTQPLVVTKYFIGTPRQWSSFTVLLIQSKWTWNKMKVYRE